MIKFDKRNTLKKKLDQIQKPIYVDEKEVRFTHLGKNIGNEEDGSGTKFKRPVLVIKRLWNMYFVVPMTTGGKKSQFFHTLPHHYFWKTSRLILSQAKFIDRRRFTHKLATINDKDFFEIKEKLKAMLL